MPTSFRVTAIFAATLAAAVPMSAQVPASWARDIPELLAAIDSIHPSPYRRHSRATWEQAARELQARVPSLHYHEFVAELSRLVALAADGHTRLGQVRLVNHQRVAFEPGPGEGMDVEYPVEFDVFSDGLFVVRASPGHADLLGRKITAVNGVGTAEAFERMRPYIPADNEAWQWHLFPRYLSSPGFVAAAGLAPSPSAPLRLSLSGAGEPSGSALAPVDSVREWVGADRALRAAGRLPRYRAIEDRYAFEYLAGSRTVYVRIREIQPMTTEPVAQFAGRLFGFVDSAAADRLVLDLRGNGGGNNYLNQPLVHGLIRATRVNRPGGLFIITDRGTFSAAVSLLGDLERNTHALVVGEPAGAPPNSYGDSRRIRLPESGVEVRISTVFWQHSDPRDPRPWIVPDLVAPLRFADWAAGRDPALEAILAYQPNAAEPIRSPNTNWRRATQRAPGGPYVVW
ncbi:MAG TPA: hypothetical protein VF862_10790 [Gemmatimonadales bacterium]